MTTALLVKSQSKRKQIFSDAELKTAHMIHKKEKIKEINPSTMFSSGVYCILSISDRWTTVENTYNTLVRDGLDNPAYVNSHLRELRRNLENIRWPKKKFTFIKEFSLWWNNTELHLEILDDIRTGRKQEFGLRDRLAESAPGLGLKSASLFMLKLGYENIVPLDIWECRFLKDRGYDVRIGDYKTISGPKDNEYLRHESRIIELAKEQKITPVIFHLALWGRSSSWSNANGLAHALRT